MDVDIYGDDDIEIIPVQSEQLPKVQPIKPTVIDPNATKGLFIQNLHWVLFINKSTTDEDLIQLISQAGCASSLIVNDLGFLEHRVNGKSRGQCFVLFKDKESSSIVKEYLESLDVQGQKVVVKYAEEGINSNPFIKFSYHRDPNVVTKVEMIEDSSRERISSKEGISSRDSRDRRSSRERKPSRDGERKRSREKVRDRERSRSRDRISRDSKYYDKYSRSDRRSRSRERRRRSRDRVRSRSRERKRSLTRRRSRESIRDRSRSKERKRSTTRRRSRESVRDRSRERKKSRLDSPPLVHSRDRSRERKSRLDSPPLVHSRDSSSRKSTSSRVSEVKAKDYREPEPKKKHILMNSLSPEERTPYRSASPRN